MTTAPRASPDDKHRRRSLPQSRTFAVSQKATHIWTTLWVVLALALVVRTTIRPDERGVILDSLEFGRRFAHGEYVYATKSVGSNAPSQPLHAPYPPSFGILMAPFALIEDHFGLRPARCAFGLLQVAALVVIFSALRRLPTGRSPPDQSRFNWLVLATLLTAARFVLRDTHGGGGNLINLAICLRAYESAERGRPTTAGLWLGLSLLTKPTQLLLLPVFWLLGHKSAVGWALATISGGVLFSIALTNGDLSAWQRWLNGSIAFTSQQDPFVVPRFGFPPFEWMNQSLRCAMARWLGTVPPDFANRVKLGVVPGFGLSLATTAFATRFLSIGATLILFYKAGKAKNGAAHAKVMVFCAALILSLALSPLSWKAHHVAMLPLLFALIRKATEQRSYAARWLLAAFIIGCALGREILGDDIDELGNSLYIVSALDCALFLAAIIGAKAIST